MNHDAGELPSPAPAENVLPGAVDTSLLEHLDDRSALGITAVLAYPTGFSFELWLFRQDTGGRHGVAVPNQSLLRLRYADGRTGQTAVPALPTPMPLTSGVQLPVLVLLRHATLGPGPARQQVWVSPLPPPGPIELALVALDGQPITTLYLEGDELRRAAERAIEVWPAGLLEPVLDAALAPPLPPAGAGPGEPDIAVAAVQRAFREVFTAGRDGLPFVQDGAVLRGAADTAQRGHPEVAATMRVAVGDVVFLDPVRAAVQFQIRWSGAPEYGPQLGYAVFDGGSWKVARGTYCRLMSWAGVECPPPPPG